MDLDASKATHKRVVLTAIEFYHSNVAQMLYSIIKAMTTTGNDLSDDMADDAAAYAVKAVVRSANTMLLATHGRYCECDDCCAIAYAYAVHDAHCTCNDCMHDFIESQKENPNVI